MSEESTGKETRASEISPHTAEYDQDLLVAVLEVMEALVVVLDATGAILLVNGACTRATGFTARELIGRPIWEVLIPPEDQEGVRAVFSRLSQGDLPSSHENDWLIRLGGRLRIAWSNTVLRDDEGRVRQIIGTGIDISRRRRAEEALRRSEERHRLIVDHAGQGIVVVQEGVACFVNPRLQELSGYSEAELRSRPFPEFLHPEDREPAARRYQARVQGAAVLPYQRLRIVCKDGSARWIESNAARITWEGRPATLTFVTDISEKLELEARLLQSQKLEAIGSLAGGIAHDFNNILTGVIGNADLLVTELPPEDPRHQEVVEIREAGERAAALAQQLLAFSRRQILEPRVIDLGALLTDLERLLRRLIGEHIALDLLLQPGLSRVKVDPSQMSQVILNLALNARDAMPGGGRLTLATRDLVVEHTPLATAELPLPTGPCVMLSVTDTGEGMSPAILERVFEPFFTTKEMGKGTGLGLSTVYGIVQQSGGVIQVESAPGRGATFRIYLPATVERPDRIVRAEPQPVTGGSETILVVEDDEVVRLVLRRQLERAGYQVLDAPDGMAALRLSSTWVQPLHLLLSDLVLPRFSGIELAARLRATRRELRLLFISGYADPALTGGASPPAPLLRKPFTRQALLEHVRSVLDAPPTAGG